MKAIETQKQHPGLLPTEDTRTLAGSQRLPYKDGPPEVPSDAAVDKQEAAPASEKRDGPGTKAQLEPPKSNNLLRRAMHGLGLHKSR